MATSVTNVEAFLLSLFPRPAEKPTRTACLEPGRELTLEEKVEFGTNEISTQKYTWYNFVGKALMEQFRRVANAYFLILSIAMMIGTYTVGYWTSPVSPWTTFGPLVLVVAISMSKEAYEDYKRYISDNEINHRMCAVIGPNGAETMLKWKELRVGMVVRVLNKTEVPADLIALNSSELKAVCYVETSNIDGETNLKLKEAMGPAAQACAGDGDASKGAPACGKLKGKMEYDAPNDRIHNFTGRLSLADKPNDEGEAGGYFPIGARNMLLRGCMLRNTKWVVGMVVYTGKDTKVMKKGGGARSKLSQLEKTMNACIIVILCVQFLLAVITVIAYALWDAKMMGQQPYLMESSNVFIFPQWLGNYFSFTILYNNFVPISLYVTVEIVNVFQALYVNVDLQMYDPESDTPARARTSNLNTDLGQIEYIFSDKTGTLTRNVMEFKQCSVAGRTFGSFTSLDAGRATSSKSLITISDLEGLGRDPSSDPPTPNHEAKMRAFKAAKAAKAKTSGFHDAALFQALRHAKLPLGHGADWRAEGAPSADLAAYSAAGNALASLEPAEVVALEAFFTCMAVCHTVVAEEDEDGSGLPIFQAESPDEAALAFAARDVGFAFAARHADSVVMRRSNGSGAADLTFQLFGTHEFNSTRKRMSVVVKTPDGRYLLMCKGADNVIFDRATLEATRSKLVRQLTALATTGLRTLVLSQRELTPAEFEAWRVEYVAASVALVGREEMLAAVAEKYESGLSVLGASAIEDRLQEGVPETIAELRRAGIKTWVLTGDKLETAINIGFSCRLLEPGMEIIRIESEDAAELSSQLEGLAERFHGSEENAKVALVVTGPALSIVMGDGALEGYLLTVGKGCKSVIACRVSPQQKSAIVYMVRKSRTPCPMTLAIGDGANDVGMIQRAEVGVGISGKEGLQAANAADFSIAQFRFLRNLLLVHGRYDYRRMSKVVLYSFYKNVVITLVIFYFNAIAGFSGTSLFESIVYSSYNLELALPIIGIGLFDRDLDIATVLAHPSVYIVGLKGRDINVRKMLSWVLMGVCHSLLTFWIPYGCFAPTEETWDSKHGRGDGQSVYGTSIFTCLFWAMQLQVAQLTLTWTYVSHILLWISLVLWYLIFLGYEYWLTFSPEFYGAALAFLSRGTYYLMLLLVLGAVLLFDLSVELVRNQFFPSEIDVQRELERGFGAKGARWGDEDPKVLATEPEAPAVLRSAKVVPEEDDVTKINEIGASERDVVLGSEAETKKAATAPKNGAGSTTAPAAASLPKDAGRLGEGRPVGAPQLSPARLDDVGGLGAEAGSGAGAGTGPRSGLVVVQSPLTLRTVARPGA